MSIYFLATFPDPNRPGTPKGGYRRNMEMLRLLTPHAPVELVVAASEPFLVDAPVGVHTTLMVHPRLPLRWLKVFWFLYRHSSPQTPIICYNPTLHTLPALWLRWLGRIVIVDYVDIQGTVVESENPWLRRLGVVVERWFIKACQHFITSSTVITERIHTLNPTANVHLYRGTFQPPDNLGQNAVIVDLPKDLVKIMYLGMMHDFSGIRELLRAFIDLNPVNAHLYIAGHGPVKQECIHLAEQFVPDKVSFPELDDVHLHPFLQQMDILTVPYLDAPRNHANFPSKIIEYLWAGKAILGTQVGEIQHALDNERTALLVPPTEVGIRAGLQRLLEDRELRERLGRHSCSEFQKRYSPITASEALCAFVAEACDQR
jgi:glycosyltransferase involved in cell wall biosynthesis